MMIYDPEFDDMREGCLFPGECCMPGPHYMSECHAPLMLMDTQPCECSCTTCEGEPHHWIEGFEEDENGEPVNPDEPVLRCKHCSAVVPMPADWLEVCES